MLFAFAITMGAITPVAYAAPGDTATLFFDDFESASFMHWDGPISPNWEVNFGSLAGIYGADVEGNTDGNDAIQRSISTAGYEDIRLSYRFKADNLDNDAINYDEVRVEYSPDGGRTWVTVYSIADGEDDHVDGTQTGLYHKFHLLPANAVNNPNFRLRFNPILVGTPDEVWIDDVRITGREMSGAPTPPPAPSPVPSPAPTPSPAPSLSPSTPPSGGAAASESSYAACNDTVDNDRDGMTDVFDLNCLIFRQTLHVTTRAVGGTLTPPDFSSQIFFGNTPLSGSMTGSATGVELTNPNSGIWRIVAGTQPGYTPQFSGDCDTAGTLSMGFNIYARCTITQTFGGGGTPPPPSLSDESGYRACGDGMDNDGDGMTDVYDLNCLNYRQTAEIVTRVTGGTALPSDARMQIWFSDTTASSEIVGSAAVIEVTNPTSGNWRLTPSPLQNYTTSFSGACDSSGNFSMGFNVRKQCVVTYTFNG